MSVRAGTVPVQKTPVSKTSVTLTPFSSSTPLPGDSHHTPMDLRLFNGLTQAKRKLEMDSPSQRPTRRRLSSACSSIGEELKSPSSERKSETSLGTLTKRFCELLHASPDGVLDLNEAAETLHVQKRRIYDITNVLEGVGLITKASKNHIRWKASDPEEIYKIHELKMKRERAENQEEQLDHLIQLCKQELSLLMENQENWQLAVTYKDIRSVPDFVDKTILAVKAPPDTILNCDIQESYRMHLKSNNGAIDVLVCPEDDTQTQSLQSPQPAPPLTPPSFTCSSNSLGASNRPNGYSSVLDQPGQGLIPGLVVPEQQDQQHHHHQHHHNPSSVLAHHATSCTTLEVGRQPEPCVDSNAPEAAAPTNPSSSSSYSQILVPSGNSDLEISLSSAADVDSDLEGLMDHFEPNSLLPIDMAMFETLSPPLQNEDFSFSMDNSTEGIHDLFDLR